MEKQATKHPQGVQQGPASEKPKLTALQAFKLQIQPQSLSEDQQTRIKEITEAFLLAGETILSKSRPSADQTAALRKLREAKQTIVTAIACEEFL